MKDNSKIKLRFGKYQGKMLKDVPDNYLRWCVYQGILKGRAMLYAKQQLGWPKDRYKVVVEDAYIGDGTYYVEAYDRKDAIRQCRKENDIKLTQSFCGTSFTVTKIK